MTYIYDVLLNFTEEERPYEFYEWEKNDLIEHIKRIPLLRVSTKTLNDILKTNITISQDELCKIENKTLSYRNTDNLKYAMLITDLSKIIALEFNDQGSIIARSNLLLNEEEEIIEEAYDTEEINLNYQKGKKINSHIFITRAEKKKQNYLIKEIMYLFKEKQYDKLKYLYKEMYKKDNLSIEKKYEKLINDLENNYNSKHNNLYEIVRLTYTKK